MDIITYIETHSNRKAIQQDIYNTLVLDWYSKTDAMSEARAVYEGQINEVFWE